MTFFRLLLIHLINYYRGQYARFKNPLEKHAQTFIIYLYIFFTI